MKLSIAVLASAFLIAAPVSAQIRFEGWNSQTHTALIAGQIDKPALYEAAAPGETLHPLLQELPAPDWASWAPRKGDVLVVDRGGQLYTLADGKPILLTDGKSRIAVDAWSYDGRWLTYTSNRRNGIDADIYAIDPRDPKSDRLVAQVAGSHWALLDFTADGTSAVVANRISPAKTDLYFMDVASGAMRPIGDPRKAIAYGDARFSYDGILWATVGGRLGMVEVGSGLFTPMVPERAGITRFELSLDGKFVAYVAKQAGAAVLKLLDVRTKQVRALPGLPGNDINDLHFAPWSALGFVVDHTLRDFYVLDISSMNAVLWTSDEIRPPVMYSPQPGSPKTH